MSEGNRTAAVRQFVSAHGVVTRKQIIEGLGITVDQARSSIKTLVKQTVLKKVSHGCYEFTGRRESQAEAPVEDRIWRAMRINPKFAASDVAIQAGTTASYFYKRLREYRAEGYVKQAGQRIVRLGVREKLWRLTLKGRDLLTRPRLEELRPDPLVVAVVKLNRLICTGMAARYPEATREAVCLANDIAERLLGCGSGTGTEACGQSEKIGGGS